MLRFLWRTGMILLVTMLVAGGVYLFTENGGMSALGIGDQSGAMAQATAPTEGEMTARPERGGGGEHAEGGFSLNGLLTIAVQLGKIAIIVAAVAVVQKVAGLFKRRRRHAGPSAA